MLYRWRKDQRYFTVHLAQDLLGDWILTRSWGDCSGRQSQYRHELVACRQHALERLAEICRRQRRKGFVEIESAG